MSIQKKILTVLLITLCILATAVVFAEEAEEDPVLNFFRERVAGQTVSRDPAGAGLTYALEIRTYKTKLEREGKFLQDSAVYTNYYSFGSLDSQSVTAATDDDLIEIDLTYPNVFAANYDFRFYPNDTGGPVLAIGFQSDTVRNLTPVGLAIVDRTRYFLHRIYLHYPHNERYERYSREISLQELGGYLFPDTVVTTYADPGIFSMNHYRIDTYVDSIHADLPDAIDTL